MDHEAGCIGYHDHTVTCKEAIKIREDEHKRLWNCPNNAATGSHSFQGGTQCANGCGRYIQELIPDANIGE